MLVLLDWVVKRSTASTDSGIK